MRRRGCINVGSTSDWCGWPGVCLRPSAAGRKPFESLDISFLRRKWGIQLNFKRTFSFWDSRADGFLEEEGLCVGTGNCVMWWVSQTQGVRKITSSQSTQGHRQLGNTLSWRLECLFHSEDIFLKRDRVTHKKAVTWWSTAIQFPCSDSRQLNDLNLVSQGSFPRQEKGQAVATGNWHSFVWAKLDHIWEMTEIIRSSIQMQSVLSNIITSYESFSCWFG